MTPCASSPKACRSQCKAAGTYNIAFDRLRHSLRPCSGWRTRAPQPDYSAPRKPCTNVSASPIEDYAVRAFAEGSAPVRERLGEVELAAAWAAGRALSEADAAAYALKTVTELPPL